MAIVLRDYNLQIDFDFMFTVFATKKYAFTVRGEGALKKNILNDQVSIRDSQGHKTWSLRAPADT